MNDEIVAEKTTNEIIDLLRIIRGSICITVARKKLSKFEESSEQDALTPILEQRVQESESEAFTADQPSQSPSEQVLDAAPAQ